MLQCKSNTYLQNTQFCSASQNRCNWFAVSLCPNLQYAAAAFAHLSMKEEVWTIQNCWEKKKSRSFC